MVPLYQHHHHLPRRSPTEGTAIIIALTTTAAFFTFSCLGCWGFARWDRRRARRAGRNQSLTRQADTRALVIDGSGRDGNDDSIGRVLPVRGVLWTPPPTLPDLPPMAAMEVIGAEGREGRELERLPGYEEVVRPGRIREGEESERGEEEALPLYREQDDAGYDGGVAGGDSGEVATAARADIDDAHIYAEFMSTTEWILQDYEVSTADLTQYLGQR